MLLVLNRAASESGAKSWIGGPTGVIMQTWVTVVVTLATLMVATVDAKIYERCELAVKLEKAGLNGFRGYSVGDCKTPVPQVPPPSELPTTLRPRPLLLIYHLPRPGYDPLGHPLTCSNVLTIIAFTTVTLTSAINTVTTLSHHGATPLAIPRLSPESTTSTPPANQDHPPPQSR